MFLINIIIYSLVLNICLSYKELKKHSSVKVNPDEKVYFNIQDFSVGELIEFEIEMDLFFGGDRTKYTFQLDQVSANNYYDAISWENLRTISATDVSCDDDDYCTFRWEEIKKEGYNYIYMIPSIPYSSFTFF